jgi:hypothetical protein
MAVEPKRDIKEYCKPYDHLALSFSMLLSLTFVFTLASLCNSAVYDRIGDVPKVEWDFIIVGGRHLEFWK